MSDTENTKENQNIEETTQASPEATTQDNLLEQLNNAQAEAEKAKDDALRARAELDNFRRRTLRDKEEFRKVALMGILEELLPVIDNFEMGLRSDNVSAEETVKGFQLVYDQFKSILTQNGLQVINPLGESFDPNKHECVTLIPNEKVEQNKVIEVARIGYGLNERLLRPANVIVSSRPAAQTENKEA
jgi:molecular chaperone GrpE